MQRDEEAAEHALEAVGLFHHLPSGHFHLGIALVRLRQLDRAVQAFDHCIAMAPRNAEALRWKNKVQDLATVG